MYQNISSAVKHSKTVEFVRLLTK